MIGYPRKTLLATDDTKDSARAVALAASSGVGPHVVHVGQAATSNVSAAATRPALPGEPPGCAERQARKRRKEEVNSEDVIPETKEGG